MALKYSPGASAGAAAGANPGAPQLKTVPTLARMQQAKEALRKPALAGKPTITPLAGADPSAGFAGNAKGAGLKPYGGETPGIVPPMGNTLQVKPAIRPMPTMSTDKPSVQGFADPGEMEKRQAMIKMLPPRMQAALQTNGRDPEEAIKSRIANDPNFAAQMQSQLSGAPQMGGPMPMAFDPNARGAQLPGAPGGPGGPMDPNRRMSGGAMNGPQMGGINPLPPGADIGRGFGDGGQPGGTPPWGPWVGGGGMQSMQVGPAQGTGPMMGGFNPASLADLYQGLGTRRQPQLQGGGMQAGMRGAGSLS